MFGLRLQGTLLSVARVGLTPRVFNPTRITALARFSRFPTVSLRALSSQAPSGSTEVSVASQSEPLQNALQAKKSKIPSFFVFSKVATAVTTGAFDLALS